MARGSQLVLGTPYGGTGEVDVTAVVNDSAFCSLALLLSVERDSMNRVARASDGTARLVLSWIVLQGERGAAHWLFRNCWISEGLIPVFV